MLHCIRNGLWIAPIFVLAGCWQKIEYKGKPPAANNSAPRATVAVDRTDAPKPAIAVDNTPSAPVSDISVSPTSSAPAATQNNPPAAEVAIAPPAPEFNPPPATPIPTPPTTTTVAKPKPADDDRYAIPAKAEEPVTSSRFAANDTQPATVPEQRNPARHTDATPASATLAVTPPPTTNATEVSPKLRSAVWVLGSRLSLAALAHDRRMASNSIPNWLDEAQAACKVLGTTVPELPEPAPAGDKSVASAQVLDYLLAQGQRIGRELAKRYGPDQAALFEVALKSNLLVLLYSQDSAATNSILASIKRAAPQSKLPVNLWMPLVEAISRKASLGDVRVAVHQMRGNVDSFLAAAAAEPGAR